MIPLRTSKRCIFYVLLSFQFIFLPSSFHASAASKSVYVVNYGKGNLAQFDTASGILSPKNPALLAAGSQPGAVAISPDSKNMYVTNYSSNTISQYSISKSGVLTPKSLATAATGNNPVGIAVTPDGKNVYVANHGASSIGMYSVGADGSLTQIAPPITSGLNPWELAIAPDGKSVYVVNFNGNTVSQFNIGADGTLALKAPEVPAGVQPWDIVITPDGKSAYVTNFGGDTISQYTINSTTGTITPKGVSTVASGDGPKKMAVSPNGLNAYVVNALASTISQYSIGNSGLLSPLGPNVSAVGSNPAAIAVTPNGKTAYSVNFNSDSIVQYSIGANGLLTANGTQNLEPGANPGSVVVPPVVTSSARFEVVGETRIGLGLTFDASGSEDGGDLESYEWDFGDGQTMSSQNPTVTHTYVQPGTYTAKLTLRSDGSCTVNTFVATGQTAYCNKQEGVLVATRAITITKPPVPPVGVVECVVPTLTGLTLKKAKSKLIAARCALGKVKKPKRKPRNTKKFQLVVVKQSKKKGVKLPQKTKVDLTLQWKKIKKRSAR